MMPSAADRIVSMFRSAMARSILPKISGCPPAFLAALRTSSNSSGLCTND